MGSIQKNKSFHFRKMFDNINPVKQAINFVTDNGSGSRDATPSPTEENIQFKDEIVPEPPTEPAPPPLVPEQQIDTNVSDNKGPVTPPPPPPPPLADQKVDETPSPAANQDKKPPSDVELMKEKFCKLLLGEDMSGGGKGVSSALALSNAITNLAASVFGEQSKLEPMSPKRKARWKKEIEWLLSVTDYIVEFVPSQQKAKDGSCMEIMVTQQRKDLLLNVPALHKLDVMLVDILDGFKDEQEFKYVSKDADESEKGVQRNDKWWLPTVKVPPNGVSVESRQFIQKQREAVNQVLKASMAINAQILSDMDIPDNYIESLPKNGRASLGESIYKSITVDSFDPMQFLSTMDLSSELTVLDLKNRIEASIVIWKRKMVQKDAKAPWGSAISLEKRELFEERAETILLLLKHQFPGIPQSSLEITKIQYNKDVGLSVLESYSRVLETLANTVMSRIQDVQYADSLAQDPTTLKDSSPSTGGDTEDHSGAETPTSMTLFDFMGWSQDLSADTETDKTNSTANLESCNKDEEGKILTKPASAHFNIIKKFALIDKIELGGFKTQMDRR